VGDLQVRVARSSYDLAFITPGAGGLGPCRTTHIGRTFVLAIAYSGASRSYAARMASARVGSWWQPVPVSARVGHVGERTDPWCECARSRGMPAL